MDRSAAGRVGIGRPFGPLDPRAVGPSGALRRGAWRPPRRRPRLAWIAASVQGGWSFLRRRRRLRVAILAAVIVMPALVGGFLWFRGSSLVAVERVHVIGVHGPEAGAIDLALEHAARQMTTLEVRPQLLRAAVAPYRVVRELQATPSFPHGLRIRVVEQLPVAALSVAGARTAVAADGVVLGPALVGGSLPVLDGAPGREADGQPAGARLHDPSLLACLSVLGAAPAALDRAVVRVYAGPDGVTVVLRGGVRAFFGDASRPHAKWLSLISVLADPSSAGATYVDVRVPERPAAGVPGAATAVPAGGGQPGSGAEPSTASELDGALAAALGGASSGPAGGGPAGPAETSPATAPQGAAGAAGAPGQETAPAPAESPVATTPASGG